MHPPPPRPLPLPLPAVHCAGAQMVVEARLASEVPKKEHAPHLVGQRHDLSPVLYRLGALYAPMPVLARPVVSPHALPALPRALPAAAAVSVPALPRPVAFVYAAAAASDAAPAGALRFRRCVVVSPTGGGTLVDVNTQTSATNVACAPSASLTVAPTLHHVRTRILSIPPRLRPGKHE